MNITVPRQRIRHQRAEAPARKSLYFAYGSNLNVEHMVRRCPKADPVAALTVRHMGLVFRGVADVTVSQRDEVPGGLWEITAECERSLDAFEGVSSRVYLKRYLTVEADGRLRDVLFYQMRASRGVMPPSEQYLQTIRDGYDDFGLDVRVLDRALQDAWCSKDVTPLLRERHDRRGRPRLARRVPAADPTIPAFYLSDEDLKQAGAR